MSSDSEDDVPLAARAKPGSASAGKANGTSAAASGQKGRAQPKRKPVSESEADEESEESEDESGSGSEESGSGSEEDSDADSDVPLAQRKAKKATPAKRKSPASKRSSGRSSAKKTRSSSVGRSSSRKSKEGEGKEMWKTLRHAGVLFPPEYEPHGVKMLYDGKPVDLTPDQEEVATMFAIMKETDYMKKPVFLKNFWDGFKEVLGKNHVIQGLEKCDFTAIYEHLMAEREKKKLMTKEVRCRGACSCGPRGKGRRTSHLQQQPGRWCVLPWRSRQCKLGARSSSRQLQGRQWGFSRHCMARRMRRSC